MASVRPVLPSWTISSTISACHACGGGGNALSSTVEATCISKQYWVSGWSGASVLAGDWDRECDGVLLNTSGSSRPFWPPVGLRVCPSVWILVSGLKSSLALDLAAIGMKIVVMDWNSGCLCTNWVQKPLQENKDTNGLAVTASYPWWVRNPFIYHQWIPTQPWGHFLPGKRYSPAFLNHQSGNLRDGCKLPQLLTVKPDLWDPTTSYWAHPGMQENVTLFRDAEWAGGFTKVMIYPVCANPHWKIVVLAALILGSSGSREVSYLPSSQATKVKLTQGAKYNLRHLWLTKQRHFPV